MERRYSDSQNVLESLRETADELESGALEVVDANQCRIVGDTRENLEERNLFGHIEQLFTIRFESNEFGGTHLTLHFHEEIVNAPFSLMPAGARAIDPTQATQPTEISDTLERVLTPFNEALDIFRWDFVKVSGASIAHGGYITDYEFKYDTFAEL